ncbi:MAG: YgiT-type zinc finger protein [Acidobacteria bacterium]|nr:YgiT-type zinc finger protein [Acidobacteriota bacterium]
MLQITICPTCLSDKIEKVCRNWTDEVAGTTYTVPNLEYYECPICGEKIYDRAAMQKFEAHSPVFAKKAKPRTRLAQRKAA